MDNQNQLKKSPSGGHDSHGVYICHRCGWPFPNPHPSARHRRAHKKICGSIEGYKLFDSEGHIHLNASDDEHEQHSDEERRTPSPKFEKTRTSVGDDVFSDAATEFSDSGISPANEEHLESITGSDKNVEKTVEADLDAGQLLKVEGIEDITKPLDSPSKSSQEPKVVETATTAPRKETSTEELGIPISSLNGSPIKSEIPMGSPKEIMLVNKEDDLDKMSATAAKPPSKTVNEASEAELQLQDRDVSVQGQSERSGLEIPKPDVKSVELRETSIKTVQFSADSAKDIGDGSQGDSVELSDTKGEKKEYLRFHSAANHFPVDQPEVLIEDFIDHKEVKSDLMSLHDVPPQAESVEHLGASFDSVETKSDSAPRVCDTELVEVCDTKGEDKEDFHVLSPADLPIVDQPEIMIQDFKDHKAVKSSLSLNLDSDAVIKTAEVSVEDAVETKSDSAPRVCDTELVEVCDTKGEDKEDFHVLSPADLPIVDQPEIMIQDFKDHKAVKSSLSLNLDSDAVIKTAKVSVEDAVEKEDILKQEGNKNNLVTEKPVEKEDDSSDLKVTHGEDLGSNGLEALPDSSNAVPKVNSVDEGRERDIELSAKVESEDSLCVSKADQISKTTGEYVGGEHENSRLEIESTGGETGKENFATNAETKLDSAFQLSELPSVDCVPDSNSVDEGRERDVELSAKVESEDSVCVSKADQISKSTGEYVGGEHETSRLEIESTGGETGKENFATNIGTKLDSASQLSELPSVDRVPDSTKVDFDPREVTKETESGIGTFATGSESNHTTDAEEVEKISMKHDLKVPTTLPIDSGTTTHITDVEVPERNSDKPIFEETGPVLVDSGFETKTSGTVDKDDSSVCYEPQQDEGDEKLLKQQVGASAVHVSVDSISQTDSLEGNWGSVSGTLAHLFLYTT
ncbi:hypothetical protein LguiA_029861 [Lonicera macranthoides]